MKILEESEVEEFEQRCRKAEADIAQRNEKLDKLYDSFENDFYLLGTTVVEDKLQDEVVETIQSLHKANIRVVVLTGDKLETAESIGFSTQLLTDKMKYILRCRTQ